MLLQVEEKPSQLYINRLCVQR